MGLGTSLPGPCRVLLVLPDDRLVEKALRAEIAVWVVTCRPRHTAAWLRNVHMRAELVLVDAAREGTVAESAVETARRNGIAYVLPAEYGGIGQRAARLLADTKALRGLLADNGHPCPVRRSPGGSRLVVSTLTVDGMHHVVGITGRTADGWRVHPAALSTRDQAGVSAAVTSLLDLADHEFGPAATEVVLTARGPCVVASRAWFARDPITQLIELASGFDPEAGLLRALGGEPLAVPRATRFAGSASDGSVVVSGGSAREVTERLGAVLPLVEPQW